MNKNEEKDLVANYSLSFVNRDEDGKEISGEHVECCDTLHEVVEFLPLVKQHKLYEEYKNGYLEIFSKEFNQVLETIKISNIK